jgi:hypothetical protein
MSLGGIRNRTILSFQSFCKNCVWKEERKEERKVGRKDGRKEALQISDYERVCTAETVYTCRMNVKIYRRENGLGDRRL